MRPTRAAAPLALLAVAFMAPGASAQTAHNGHQLVFESRTAPDGAEVYGTEVVAVVANFADGVKSWKIAIRPAAGGTPKVCEHDYPAPEKSPGDFRCSWDTTRDGDGNPSFNGRYTLEVTATNAGTQCGFLLCSAHDQTPHPHELREPGTSPPRWREVFVGNPVSKPAGVSRSFASASRTVTVTWNRNPEPDIQKYLIQEKVGDGGWHDVGERPSGSTSFQRSIADVGTYSYRVGAVRAPGRPYGSAPTHSQLQSDGYLVWSDAAAPIEVAAEPAAPITGPAEGEPTPAEEPGAGTPEPATSTSTTTTAAPAPGGTPGAPAPRAAGGSPPPRPAPTRPTGTTARATPPTTIDTGYSDALPYRLPEQNPEVAGDDDELAGGEESRTIEGVVEAPHPRDARSLLIPMAGGLAIFVLAMQVTYALRRRPALAHADEDFGDWMGLDGPLGGNS